MFQVSVFHNHSFLPLHRVRRFRFLTSALCLSRKGRTTPTRPQPTLFSSSRPSTSSPSQLLFSSRHTKSRHGHRHTESRTPPVGHCSRLLLHTHTDTAIAVLDLVSFSTPKFHTDTATTKLGFIHFKFGANCVGDYAGEDGGNNYSQHFKNLDKLVKKINEDVLSKLDGSANATSSRSSKTSGRTGQQIPEPVTGFGDPAGPLNHPTQIIYPSVPMGSGHSDLVPGPPAGVLPSSGDHGIGGSMLVGPNDPRWFGSVGGIGGDPAFPGGLPGVPPGARFDPYGPPGVPGFEPNRFARNPRRPGYDAHPDLQHFRRDADSDYI